MQTPKDWRQLATIIMNTRHDLIKLKNSTKDAEVIAELVRILPTLTVEKCCGGD